MAAWRHPTVLFFVVLAGSGWQSLGPLVLPGHLPFDESVDPLLGLASYIRTITFAALHMSSSSSEMTAMLMWNPFIMAHLEDVRVVQMIQHGAWQIVFDNAIGSDLMTGQRGSQQEPGIHYLRCVSELSSRRQGWRHHWEHSHAKGADIIRTWGQFGNKRVDELAVLARELKRVLVNWGSLGLDIWSGELAEDPDYHVEILDAEQWLGVVLMC